MFYLNDYYTCVRRFVVNAALTHTSRPYCDLKTSKIAFFFRKSFGFLSNFSRRRSGALQSCVFSMSSIRPFYVHGVSTATILRPQGDPTAIIGDPDATVLRSLRPYGDSTATIASYYDVAATMSTPTDLTRTQQECRVSATVLRMFKIFADGLRPWVPRYDLAASLLRPWRLCLVLDRSKVAVRTP